MPTATMLEWMKTTRSFGSPAARNGYYATTSNWSLLGVATGNATETMTVALPSKMPAGNYSMVVSGAGINSFPVGFHLAAAIPGATVVGQGVGNGSTGQMPGSPGVVSPFSVQRPRTVSFAAGQWQLQASSSSGSSETELGVLPVLRPLVVSRLIPTGVRIHAC